MDTILRTESSRTVCTTQAMSVSGGSYLHFPRHLSCVTLLFSLYSKLQARIHFAFMISLKICLTISFLSSSQALMSSARIPLLSGDLPFFEFPDRILQFFTRDLWYSRHFFSVAKVHVSVTFMSIFVLLIVVLQFLKNPPKTFFSSIR